MGDSQDLSRLFDSVVGTVVLRVSDAGLQRDFYERAIGFAVTSEEGSVTELRGAPGEPLIRLEATAARGAGPPLAAHTGLFHTAFRYPDRAALGAAVRRTAPLAREYQGASDHGVSEAVYFADPEGNGIELYRDRPYDEWPAAEPGRVGMFTHPLDLAALVDEAGAEAPPDIGHIHLKTADVEEALVFWRDLVGLDERQRFGAQAAFLAEGLYHHHLGANSWHSAGAPPTPERAPGLESFELRLHGQGAVDEAAERLARAGVEVERGERSIRFRDPDSNLVVLTRRA